MPDAAAPWQPGDRISPSRQSLVGEGATFPARSEVGECTVTSFDGSLDQLAERAGWQAGEIRTKMFRHTYCAARLQTLDHARP